MRTKDNVSGLTRDDIDDVCQEKKEEKDSPAVKILWTHWHENSKNTLKRAKKD